MQRDGKNRVSPSAIDRTIGNNLRAMRIASGLSQHDVGVLLGVTYQQVQKQERGNNRISAAMLAILQSFYGVSYDRFFAGTGIGESQNAFPEQAFTDPSSLKAFYRLTRIRDPDMKQKILKIINILTA